MSYWNENFAALKEKEEALSDKLLEVHSNLKEIEAKFVVEQARDASNILGVWQDGKKTMLNSTYRPNEEAVKYAGKIQLTENSITFFVGLGNGAIVSEILKKLNEESNVLLYEASSELFCYVMEHFDVSAILSDSRVGIFVEDINADVIGNNLSYLLNNMNVGVTVMEYHPKYKELYQEVCEKAEKIFMDCRDSALTNLRTVLDRSRLMTKNAIANIPFLLRSKISTDLVGKFPTDMPAILVAGGPSLDKNYEVLHQAKGKALIVAMDRTARFLLDHGIEPDIFCSLDYAKNQELFRDERLKNIPFLYIPDLSHNVMKIVDGRKLIYGTGDFRFYDWIIQKYGKKPMQLPLGGSVATFAYGFVRYMGFKRTILIGQDLALNDGKVYAGGLKNKRKVAEQFEHLMVPGNIEDMVETRGDFYVYLTWFQQAVKEAEGQMEVINATEGGARIEGTRIMTLQEAVDSYCTKQYDIPRIFDEQTEICSQEERIHAIQDLEDKVSEFLKLKEKAHQAAELARRCSVLAERGDAGKEFKEKNKKLSKISKLFDEDVAASLVNKYVENVMIEKDMDLYVTEDNDQKEMIRLYRKLEYDYNVIYENMEEFLSDYEAMLVVLRKEMGMNE